MKLNTLKRTLAISAFGLAALLGTSEVANAQGNRQIQRQQQKVEKQQQKVQNQRERLQTQQIKLEQQRQEQLRQQNMRSRNANNNRYRVYRNGSYYQTDARGAELLKQAVNSGYQQGFQAGQADRRNRRNGGYNNSSIYRNGNYGYQSYVDSNQYQYYFRQGFERGYQDGYNSRNQYGASNNGGLNILGSILQGILNLQQF